LFNTLNISILIDYSTNLLIMISKANKAVNALIMSILQNNTAFVSLQKSRKRFIVNTFWLFLCVKGKINFLQLERFGTCCEQTYREQFKEAFDFCSFNTDLIKQVVSSDTIVAFDPSFIPKAGKSTYGGSRYWSGVAKSAKWGLDICGFAVVDVTKNTALHLKAWQTPPPPEIEGKEQTLLTYYASLVTDNADKFLAFSTHMVADAYFSKKPVVDAVLSVKLNFISRLRDDSHLKYKYIGQRTGLKGAPKKYTGRIDVKNLDIDYFSLDTSLENVKIYSATVYSKAFKRDIKLAVAVFLKGDEEVARKLYFSTDLALDGLKIVRYYRSRFQIEFLYRDAKQFTSLNTCQARSKNQLEFHFNAALTAVNLAKYDWIKTKGEKDKAFSMSDYKTLYNNSLMIEQFISRFAINPHTVKNQKIIKELLEYGKIAA